MCQYFVLYSYLLFFIMLSFCLERYFYVEIRKNVVTNIHTANNPTVDDEMAFRYASDVFGTAEGFGYKGNYMYLNTVNGDNSLIVFIH